MAVTGHETLKIVQLKTEGPNSLYMLVEATQGIKVFQNIMGSNKNPGYQYFVGL